MLEFLLSSGRSKFSLSSLRRNCIYPIVMLVLVSLTVSIFLKLSSRDGTCNMKKLNIYILKKKISNFIFFSKRVKGGVSVL